MTQAPSLDAYIPIDRRHALAGGTALASRSSGSVLETDVSGFTSLTALLARDLGRRRGAEELTRRLNVVFDALVTDVHEHGGAVVNFSGDSITCWFEGDSGLHATAAALAMQRWMQENGAELGSVGEPLGLKAAVATGSAWRFAAGDTSTQLIDGIAGEVLDVLAATEHAAKRGEVLLDPSAVRALGDSVALSELRTTEGVDEPVGVVESLAAAPDLRPWPTPPSLPEDVSRPWLIPAVFDRLVARHGDFLAELRPAVALFLRFSGIDFASARDVDRLDRFIRDVHGVLGTYEGSLIQLTIGDKGRYLYAAFGAPIAHEDDANRAVSAALELRDLEGDGVDEIAIGVAAGRMRIGPYGGSERMTYGVLGEATNLAARLMQGAQPGEIVVSQEIHRETAQRFEYAPLELMLKGRTEPYGAFRFVAATAARTVADHPPLVGRQAELAALEQILARALDRHGQVVALTGPAGIGKTRLVEELTSSARARGVGVHVGECWSYATGLSYLVWQPIWRALLGDSAESVEAALASIDERLVPRLPLLGPVLDLDLPDNDLTRTFEPKLRKASLESLLAECLRQLSRDRPLALVLDDAHWIDPLSADLLDVLTRAAIDEQVMIIVAQRGTASAVATVPSFTEIALAELDDDAVAALTRLLVADPADERLVARVVERAQGNPFYARELLSYLEEGDDDEGDLPANLQSLILSRVDRLPEAPRSTLKVASVVGRSFAAPMLPRVHAELGDARSVGRSLDTLASRDFVEQETESQYLFQHVLTQEVAYAGIPFAQRSRLHERVAEAIELDSEGRELDVLAYHYGLSENEAKKRDYLLAAGDAAQARYANASAIDYFERALELVAEDERPDVLLKLGKVLELAGRWEEADERYEEVVDTGVSSLAALGEIARADLMRKQGRFDDAQAALDRGSAVSEAVGDEAGIGQALHIAGTIAAQRGDNATARARYEESLAIRDRLGDAKNQAALLSNLGVIAEYEADYGAARVWNERALAIRTETGDQWAIAVSLNNLGNIALLQGETDEARSLLERALTLHREVGDPAMIANAGNNLANVLRNLGERGAAEQLYRESLALCRDLGDRWAIAYLLEDMAVLYADDEPERALYLAGAAGRLREVIDAPRPAASKEELDRDLTPARATPAAGVAWARGYGASLEAAVSQALGETAETFSA